MPTAVVHELQRQKVSDSGGPLAVAITHDPTLGVARDEIDVENNFEHATEMADSDTQPTNDLAKRQHKSCAIGWVSYLTFAWAMPLLRVGASRPLRNDDLPDVQQTHTRYFTCYNEMVSLVLRSCSGKTGLFRSSTTASTA